MLVFVSKWLTREEMQATPEQVIPSFLFLADGRVIPTCVILAEHVSPSRTVDNLTFPSRLIGGGYPILDRRSRADARRVVGLPRDRR